MKKYENKELILVINGGTWTITNKKYKSKLQEINRVYFLEILRKLKGSENICLRKSEPKIS
jgi:hypothetical protein